MTDKEKIRKEVERLRNLHQMKYQQLDTNDNMCLVECGKRNLCDELLSFIDSLQEEPQVKNLAEIQHFDETCKESVNSLTQKSVSNDFEMALAEMIDKAQKCVVEPLVIAEQWKDELIKLAKSDLLNLSNVQRIGKDWKEEPVSESIDFEQELYKAFGQIKDFTLGVAIAKRFYDMGRKHNEPVSKDLEEAAKRFATEGDEISGLYIIDEEVEAFEAGAKWQKEQFEKNRLKHCNSITNEQAELEQGFIDQHLDKHQRMPTFLNAIEYGMRLKEKQIIENATEATVAVDAGGYPYVDKHIELYDYDKDVPLAKEGDKYKVVLINSK